MNILPRAMAWADGFAFYDLKPGKSRGQAMTRLQHGDGIVYRAHVDASKLHG